MGEGSFHVEFLLCTGCYRFAAGPVTTLEQPLHRGKRTFSISIIHHANTRSRRAIPALLPQTARPTRSADHGNVRGPDARCIGASDVCGSYSASTCALTWVPSPLSQPLPAA